MAETVDIPRIKNPYMRLLSVCGEVRTRKSAAMNELQRIAKNEVILSKSGRGATTQYVSLFGGRSIKNHLHVNFVAHVKQKRKKLSIPLQDQAAIEQPLSRLIGEAVDVSVMGRFVLPAKRLPKSGLIRSEPSKKVHQTFSIRQTGQWLEIGEDPVLAQLMWRLSPDHKNVRVEIRIEDSLTIDRTYLSECMSVIESLFIYLVMLGAEDDAAITP